MRRAALCSFTLVSVVFGGCAADPSAGTRESIRTSSLAIVDGTPSTTANDAVVMLAIGNQGEFCSGTLIAPNLLLTARHCLTTLSYQNDADECGYPSAITDATTMTIETGIHASASTAVAKGKKVYVEQDAGCGHDLALLLLDRDVPNAKLAKVNLAKVTLGEAMTTSGYGEDGVRQGELTNGRYDKTGIKIDFIGPGTYDYKTTQNQTIPFVLSDGEIVTGTSTCFGDSGGPLFDSQGLVVGTTWRGVDGSCVDRPSSYSAVASHVDFVKQAAMDAGHPIEDAPAPTTPPAGGTAPSSDNPPASSGDGSNDGTAGSADTGDDGDTSGTTTPTKKHGGTLASQGCAAGGGDGGSGDGLSFGALVLGAALISRRRRARPART